MRAYCLTHNVFGEKRAPFCVGAVCIIFYQLHQHYSQVCVRGRQINLASMPSSVDGILLLSDISVKEEMLRSPIQLRYSLKK